MDSQRAMLRYGEDESLSREAVARCSGEGANLGRVNSVRSFQLSEWQRVPCLDYNNSKAAGKPAKIGQPSIHHFGLLDVPEPKTFFSTPQLADSWRGHSHVPVPIPEAADVVSPLEKSGASQQPIRPRAGRTHNTHHSKPNMRSRSGMQPSTMEGSATSDDHENGHSRLIPKRGQGPGLRSEGGGKIDEYLMRLLHTNRPHAQSSEQPTSDGATPRHASRLGPLAGAGVMASSIQPPANGNLKDLKEANGNGVMLKPESTDALTEPKSEPTRFSSKTQPSIAGANTEKASMEPGPTHAFKRKASADLNEGIRQPPEAAVAPAGNPQPIGIINSHPFKQRLGLEQWKRMRSTVDDQMKEFYRQVTELHRLAELTGGAGATPPQKAQEGSPRSSKPSWRNTPSSINGPSWRSDMQRFNSAAEAFSWPAFQAANKGAQANSQDARKQKSEPVRGVSQTTQLVLEAQRMRRQSRSRNVNKAPSIGNQLPARLHRSKSGKSQTSSGKDFLAAQTQLQNMQQQLWNPFLQQQMMANHAMQIGQAGLGRTVEMNDRRNSAQMMAHQDTPQAWAKQQQPVAGNGVHPANLNAQQQATNAADYGTGTNGKALNALQAPALQGPEHRMHTAVSPPTKQHIFQ